MGNIKLTIDEAKAILTREEPKIAQRTKEINDLEEEGFILSNEKLKVGHKAQLLIDLRVEIEAYGEL